MLNLLNNYLSIHVLNKKEIKKSHKLFSEDDEKITAIFKALSDINRYRIFRILVEQPSLSVSSIANILNISLPLASQHIKILKQSNLLHKERKGKIVFSKLKQDNPLVKIVIKTIKLTNHV